MKKFTFAVLFNGAAVQDLSHEQATALTRGLPVDISPMIIATAPNGKEISASGSNAWAEIMTWVGPYSSEYL